MVFTHQNLLDVIHRRTDSEGWECVPNLEMTVIILEQRKWLSSLQKIMSHQGFQSKVF